MAGPPTGYSLLDLILAGGLLGYCSLALFLLGLPIAALTAFLAKRRRTAIVVPAVFSAIAFLLGAAAIAFGYHMMNARVAQLRAEGETVPPGAVDDSLFLIKFTAGQHAVVTVAFLAVVALVVFLKRDAEPAPQAGPERPPA